MNEYLYKIEINCFQTYDHKYEWKVWHRYKEEDDSAWVLFRFGNADSEDEAYIIAQQYVKRDILMTKNIL